MTFLSVFLELVLVNSYSYLFISPTYYLTYT